MTMIINAYVSGHMSLFFGICEGARIQEHVQPPRSKAHEAPNGMDGRVDLPRRRRPSDLPEEQKATAEENVEDKYTGPYKEGQAYENHIEQRPRGVLLAVNRTERSCEQWR